MTRFVMLMLWGMVLSAITLGCGTSPPSVPENVVANAVSSSEMDVSWDKSSDFGNVDNYRVYRNEHFYIKVKGTKFRDSGLKNATEYCYRVRAVDEVGNRSDKSERACDTTHGTPIINAVGTSVNASEVNIGE